MNEVTFDKTWADTIHRSKYFMAHYAGHSVQIRYANHDGSGNDIETVLRSKELIEIGDDMYYEIENFRVYSRKMKSMKVVVAAIKRCETAINDIIAYCE